MNQKIINKTWITALAILTIFSFGLTGQVEGKSNPVEANAKASTYIGVAPLQVQFSAENSVTDEGTIRTCKWKGDGIGVQKGMIVNYTFNEPGNYAVNLFVKNSLGDFDRDTVNIEVCPRKIHVDDMSISLISGIGDSVKAKVVVTITDDQGLPVADAMVRGRWHGLVKGNATGISCAEGKVVFVSDSTSNEGKIKFRVKNAGVAGCKFIQANNLIKISTDDQINLPPEINITTNLLNGGPPPLKVQFSAGECYDPDGEVIDYQWDFGNGNSGAGRTCDIIYEGVGIFYATLSITDDQGETATGKVMITVIDAPD